jgi:tRNA1Val (adenine37-N6)-methyltransferase
MASDSFKFKQFEVFHDRCPFKVGTDGVILGAYADVSGTERILDIGTGSGLIALMLAQRSKAEITGIEPDKASFEQACNNVIISKWNGRIHLINTSLQNYDPEKVTFDLIVTNPPFFVGSLRNPDPVKAATRHNVSLNSHDLLMGVSRMLNDAGIFQVIMPYSEGNILIAEATEFGLYCNDILKIKPLPTSDVRRLIITFSRKKSRATEKFLTIEYGKRHEFTKDYIDLTKDFYLKF